MASLKVAVRVRPFNQREKDMDSKLIIKMDGKKTRLLNKVTGFRQGDNENLYKDFTFDYSYWSHNNKDSNFASQEQVYSDLGTDVVDSAFEGYNACVFAYGQTGSGKTFTMMGSPDCQGLIPRICKSLFSRMHSGKEKGASYRTEVSYLEIYNERVKDLLRTNSGHSLKVREHPKSGPYVQDLSLHLVSDYEGIQECMLRGNSQRTTASTNMNDVSSRSHAIFTVTFVQAGYSNDMPSETVSKVHLVDLAGSERADSSGATGQRLKEGAHINKSLVTLGSVISALAELSASQANSVNKARTFIPYRDSVLTWLLKDSLGGNSKTIMIAAISPADCNYGETLSTLRYANRAKNIINKPTINEDPNVKLIRELRAEISKLKSLMTDTTLLSEPQVLATLHQKEAQEKVLTEEWTEKWRETQQILQEQTALGLRKSGLGVVLDSDIPHLVGIDDDLLSTGVTLYHLKEGETLIGSEEAATTQDIVLNGPDVLPNHCSITLNKGVAVIHPKEGAQCWLNTVLIEKSTRLSQGCILLLGRTNMFRYNDPVEAAKLRQGGSKSRLNLSRLSLLSWSTSDLAASSENLLAGDDGALEQQRAELQKEKNSFEKEQSQRELGWKQEQRKKLEELENAQKQLQLVREEMELTYRAQCLKLAEDWQRLERIQNESKSMLLNKECEIHRQTEELMSERGDIHELVEHVSANVKELTESLEIKKRALKEYIQAQLKKITKFEDQDVECSSECSSSDVESPHTLDDCINTLMRLSKEAYVHMSLANQQGEVTAIENSLKTHTSDLAKHMSQLSDIDSKLFDLKQQQLEIDEEQQKLTEPPSIELPKVLTDKTVEQSEEINKRKMSLILPIKNPLNSLALSSVENSSDASTSIGPSYTSPLKTSDTYHTADSDCSIQANDKFLGDSGVDMEKAPSTLNSEKELNNTQLINDISDESCKDNTNVSNIRSIKNGKQKLSSNTVIYDDPLHCNLNSNDYDSNRPNCSMSSNSRTDKEFSKIMDDSSSTISNKSSVPSVLNSLGNSLIKTTQNNSKGTISNTSTVPLKTMQRIQHKIARQKMIIMRILEGDSSKEELDKQIANLQDLQRQRVQLEKYLQEVYHSNADVTESLNALNIDCSASEASSDPDTYCSYSGDAGLDPLNNDNSNSLQYTSVYYMGQGEDCTSPFALSLSRPMPTFNGEGNDKHVVSVTGFVVRGARKKTHVEYEVRIYTDSESWTLLRRYSKFRDLHLTMKSRYGLKVAALNFPPRHLFFSSSDETARIRRNLLDLYLQNLLQVCADIPSCPLYACRDGPLTKLCLLEFSDFFRKGMFESTRYGTS